MMNPSFLNNENLSLELNCWIKLLICGKTVDRSNLKYNDKIIIEGLIQWQDMKNINLEQLSKNIKYCSFNTDLIAGGGFTKSHNDKYIFFVDPIIICNGKTIIKNARFFDRLLYLMGRTPDLGPVEEIIIDNSLDHIYNILNTNNKNKY